MRYDLHEVPEAVGLSPTTLQNYTSRGRSDLVRGEDFIVRRVSPYRRQSVITERADFAPRKYGFAFPLSSPLERTLNPALLGLIEDGFTDRISLKYLGTAVQ